MRRDSSDSKQCGLAILISILVIVSGLSFLTNVTKAQPGSWTDLFVDESKISTKFNAGVLGGNAQILTLATDYSWQKQGVVLPHGTGGDPDSNYATYPWVLKDSNGLYRMWYTGVDAGNAYSIQYATSWDGYDWTKQGTVIPSGFSGTVYDSSRVYSCALLHEGGVYRMWYTGQTPGDVRRILYATSPDGQTWTYDSLALDVGGAGESRAVAFPSVLNDSGTYKMWYHAMDTGGDWETFHATSSDGSTWAKQGRVMPLGSPGSPDDASIVNSVVTKNSTGDYRMWYGAVGTDWNILYAESSDGIDWSDRRGISIAIGLPGEPDEVRLSLGNVRLPVNNAGWKWYAGYDASPDAKGMIATMGSLGNLTSVEITKAAGDQWNMLYRNKTTIPDETEVLVSVIDSNTLRPFPGLSDLSGTMVDLSSINPAVTGIRLRADFYGTITQSPLLEDWAVTWRDLSPPLFGGLTSASDDGTDGDVTLDWNPATDPSTPITYNVYMALSSMGQNFAVPDYTTQALTLQISGLTNGVTYYFVVRAEDSLGYEETNTIERNAIPTTPIDSTPPTFAGLQSALDSGTDGNVSLSWNSATDPDTPESNSDPSLPIAYNIYYSETSGGQNFLTPDITTGSTSQEVTGLTNGITYYFVVRAEDSAGNEEGNTVELSAMPTTPIDDTIPTFVGLISAMDLGIGGTVQLNWNAATDPDTIECNSDPSLPINYNIYYSKIPGGQDFLNPNATTTNIQFDVVGLDNGILHYFVVRAMDSAGNEESNLIEKGAMPTTPVDTTPPSFGGLQSAVDAGTGGTVSLDWPTATDPDTPECNSDPSTPINYDVFYSTTSGGQDFLTPSASTQNLLIDITGLTNGVPYYFVVRARDSVGNGDNNTVERMAIPTTPVDSTPPVFAGVEQAFDSQTDGNVTLVWSAATDPDTIECNTDPSIPITYSVFASTIPGNQNFLLPTTTTQSTTIDVTGLSNGVTYYFVVRAKDSAGNEETNTVELSAMPTTPIDDTPPTFSGLVLASDAGAGGAVDLIWAAATDPDLIECNSDPSLPISYNIYISIILGAQDFLTPNETVSGTQATISGLQNGITYYFVVRAEDTAGNEDDNVIEQSAMPTTPIDNTPPVFTGLDVVVTDDDKGDVTLQWGPAEDPDTLESNTDPTSPITYNIYVSDSSTNFDFSQPTATTSMQQYPFLDLERGVMHYFIVRAEDGAGNEETNSVVKSAQLEVIDDFDILDYWWLLLIIIIVLLAAILAVVAKRKKKEEPEEEPVVEEEEVEQPTDEGNVSE